MDDEQELLELEEEQEVVETVEDDGIKPISLSPDSIATDTVPNIINHYLSQLRFGFYITKINKDYNCDTFFPTSILNDKFAIFRGWSGTSEDLNFIVYTRKYTNYLSK